MGQSGRPSLPLVAGLALVILAGAILQWGQNGREQHPLRVAWDDLPLAADDAVRIVQVRDLARGQDWFDLRQTRMGADRPVPMHWSRLVDAPLLLLRRAAGTVTDPAQAERAAAALWPRILAFFWIALSLGLAGQLAGRRGVWCAAFLLAPAAIFNVEFFPGRVDHHNLQLVLVLAAASAAIAAPARPPLAAVAAGATALSLAVGLETLPVLAPIGGLVALAWAIGNTAAARRVAIWFSLGLAAGLPLVMATTLPPITLTTPLCDQLSAATALPVGLVALGLAALEFLLRHSTRATRLLGLGGLAVAAIALGAVLAPHCLEGPYARLDPEVLRGMDDIVERRNILAALQKDFADSLYRLVIWPVTGLFGLGLAILTARRGRRFAPAVLFAMALMATLVMYVELRGYRFALPLTFFGGVWILARATELGRAAWAAVPAALLVLLFAVTPLGWIVAPGFSSEAGSGIWAGLSGETVSAGDAPTLQAELHACTADAEVAPLAALPPGRVLAAINLGPNLLLKTPHHVIAAPYHRNVEGLRAGFRLPRAAPDEVRAMAERLGVDYLVVCRGYFGGQPPRSGSAFQLLRDGAPPPWLEPLPGGERLRAYRVEVDPDTARAPAAP